MESIADKIKYELIHNKYTNNKFFYGGDKITDIDDDNIIWEIGKFDPELISLDGYATNDKQIIRNIKLIKNMQKHIEKINSNGKLIQYLENASNNYINGKMTDKLNSIMKLLLNDDIIKTVSQEEILDFVETNDRNKLIEIIRKTYGDISAKILIDRPQIDIDNITNTYIFSPKIIDEFGIGAVHASLSYSMTGTAEMAELARDSEKMSRFKQFNEITKDMFDDTAIDLDRKLRAFEESEYLMQSLNGRELTSKQKENLGLAINSHITSSNKLTVPIEFPKTLEELDTYKDKLYLIYDEVILKSTDANEIKNAMSKKYFGLSYNSSGDIAYLNEPSVLDMIRYYNINGMINDPRVIESGGFSQDDLDALEILSIISEISDPEILKKLSTELQKNNEVINYKHFKQLKKSVPQLYTEEMVSSLMTVKKAEEMVKNATPGIFIREEDGVKIVTLKGADFKAYISNPYLNNSNVKLVNFSNVDDVWQNFEMGISTFSGCLVDQSVNPDIIADHHIPSLGFYSIDPAQIIGMGSTDIHITHFKYKLEPITTYSDNIEYGFSEDLLDRTSDRLYGGNDKYQDNWHKYNEVASQRRIQNLSEIEEGTHGGKINPDYIFAYGTKQTKDAIALAKKFGINIVFEYEPEPYKKRKYERLRKVSKEQTQKEDSAFIKDIKNIAKGSNRDDRE